MRNVIIPAYEYPGPIWDTVFNNADSVYAAILNPGNGVGPVFDQEYKTLAKRLNDAGIVPLAYVFTSYGKRSAVEIQMEVELWKRRYPDIQGIFYDEVTSTADKIGFYGRLTGIAKTLIGANSIVVLNPGAIPDPGYATVADIITTAETDQRTYLARDFPKWEQDAKAYHIVYGVTDVAAVLAKMSRVNADYVYLTSLDRIDGKGPEYDVGHSLFAPKPIVSPPTGSSPNSTENFASLTLQEIADIIDLHPDLTLKDVPSRIRQIVDRNASLEAQINNALTASTDEEILADVLRRLKAKRQ